ncbi:hypothetical protein EAI_05454, partial [Harpegnathos saltator]
HNFIAGNEKADQLAKKGAKKPFIGLEPGCGLPKSHVKLCIQK